MAVTAIPQVVLTPVLPTAENVDFTKRLGAATKNYNFEKKSVSIRSIPFKCIFVRLDKAFMRG